MAKKTKINETIDIDKKMADDRAEIDVLVKKWNDSKTFAEFTLMDKIANDIAEKVADWNEWSETKCFNELKKAEHPLFEAAKVLRYPVISVKDERQKGASANKVVNTDGTRQIDPHRLHTKVEGGIGANKDWEFIVQRLNKELCARKMIELGLNPKELDDSYAMAEEAKALEGFTSETFRNGKALNLTAANKRTMANMQLAVNAMIGEGYTVTEKWVNYLLSFYLKKNNRQQLKLAAANHTVMRQYMLEICHALITGADPTVEYKAKKK